MPPTTIIFVCVSNTCRSPMCEYLTKEKLSSLGITNVTVASRSLTEAYEPEGSPANEQGIEVERYVYASMVIFHLICGIFCYQIMHRLWEKSIISIRVNIDRSYSLQKMWKRQMSSFPLEEDSELKSWIRSPQALQSCNISRKIYQTLGASHMKNTWPAQKQSLVS